MIEDVKETIIERIGELAQDASASTLKVLATTLEIVDKLGREDINEKYLSAMMELFKKMEEHVISLPHPDLKLPEGIGLADIADSKLLKAVSDGFNNQIANTEIKE